MNKTLKKAIACTMAVGTLVAGGSIITNTQTHALSSFSQKSYSYAVTPCSHCKINIKTESKRGKNYEYLTLIELHSNRKNLVHDHDLIVSGIVNSRNKRVETICGAISNSLANALSTPQTQINYYTNLENGKYTTQHSTSYRYSNKITIGTSLKQYNCTSCKLVVTNGQKFTVKTPCCGVTKTYSIKYR